MSSWPEEKHNSREAKMQAEAAMGRKDVVLWLRKLRWLRSHIPHGCWVYSEGYDPHLMAMSPDGRVYMTHSGGTDPAATIGSAPGGTDWDSGAW